MKHSTSADSGKSYSDLLKDPRWQKLRLTILNRDKFTCQLCGDTETTLEIHHKVYKKRHNPWEYSDDTLIAYCEDCHQLIEWAKKHGIDYTTRKVLKLKYPSTSSSIAFLISRVDKGFDYVAMKEDAALYYTGFTKSFDRIIKFLLSLKKI